MVTHNTVQNKSWGGTFGKRLGTAIFVILLILASPFPALAGVTVSLEVDRTSLQVGDIFGMTVSVSGARSSDSPQVAGLGGFRAVGAGTSSRFSFTNGQSTSGVDHKFRLTATKVGNFTIGPAKVRVGGKTYSSQAVKVNISAVPNISGASEGPMFLVSQMTTERVYPGQEAIYTLSLYWSNELTSYFPPTMPEITGLTFQSLGQPKQYQTSRNGKKYGVVEFTYSVIAQDFKTYELPPVSLRVQIAEQRQRRSRFPRGFNDDIFGRQATKDAMLASNSVSFSVGPFPEKNRPVDFNGLVGWYSAEATLEPGSVKAGESATVTLSIVGRGNVNFIPDVEFPKIPGVKVYSDQPGFTEQRTAQGPVGKKVMKWALVPQTAETVVIPPFSISYFNTDEERYATAETKRLSLEVTPGEAVAVQPSAVNDVAAVPLKQQVELLGADILRIHESPKALEPGLSIANNQWAALLILLLPFTPFASAMFIKRIQKKSAGQIRARSAKKAFGIFSKTLKDLSPDQTPEIQKTLQEYLAARLFLDAATLTSAEAQERLLASNVSQEHAIELNRLFSSLEISVFSRGGQAFTPEMKQDLTKIVRIIDKKVRL